MAVEKGNNVVVDYEGRLESGEIFDSSQHGDHSHPIEFEAGSGKVIKGFDDAVIGMNEGEEKEIEINPDEAYGQRNEDMIKQIPKSQLPEEQREKVKEGMMLGLQSPDGKQIPAKIVKVDDENISIDLNHPLAGKKLIFKIKIKEIK